MTDLANKPLVEVVFELRWDVQLQGNGTMKRDPLTNLLFARLYEPLTARYPDYEELEASLVPDELAVDTVQHRFKAEHAEADAIGMVQFGPGVVTLNVTSAYTWEAFRSELAMLTDDFLKAFPTDEYERFNSMALRYIDDVPAEEYLDRPLAFMRENMGCEIRLRDSLFGEGVGEEAHHVDLRLAFPTHDGGELEWRAVTARRSRDGTPVVAWFTSVRTGITGKVDSLTVMDWADSAHDLQVHWFEQLTAGDLYRSFQ